MKKVLLFILVLFIVSDNWAQPNGGFETWITEFSYETPESWQTFNILSLGNPPASLSAFKVTGLDKHSGNYALKLKSVFANSEAVSEAFGDTAGGTYTGKIIYSPFSFKYGFSYGERAEKLEFWAKYNPIGNDTGGAAVILTKWMGTYTDTIAGGLFDIPPTPNYTLFQKTLEYRSEQIPDTATIFFYTSKKAINARLNSTLFLDDVSLTGWVGIDEQKRPLLKAKVFPNPATELLTIQVVSGEADNAVLTDISGRNIGEYKVVNDRVNIDTRQFQNGIYFYELKDNKNISLTKGKFNVLK